jgi:hypothetical protein
MKFLELWYWIVFGSVLLLPGCSLIEKKMGLPEDNLIEEVAEAIVKVETGVDVDLTPGSKEK